MAENIAKEVIKEMSQNATDKPVASTEGMAVAYSSLIIMALIPIFFGSFRSVKYLKKQKESGEKLETMSHKDAAMFPLFASVALLGLYIFFKIFSKEYINYLVTAYFFALGIFAMVHILSPILERYLPDSLDVLHNFVYTRTEKEKSEEMINTSFTNKYLVSLGLCSVVGLMYLYNKHWLINNLFGIAFAINGVELLHLNNIVIGCTLLGGLFVYDVFWVFGTDVMVTVAKSFEAPIKLVFPQDIFENLLEGKHFAMLGLGDVVIPGIFIALLLRFDLSLNRRHNLYFYSSFVAYFMGLVFTIFIMTYFKHAQPALLYLVPACIGTPVCVAAVKGDIKALFTYEDHPENKDESPDGKAQNAVSGGEGDAVENTGGKKFN